MFAQECVDVGTKRRAAGLGEFIAGPDHRLVQLHEPGEVDWRSNYNSIGIGFAAFGIVNPKRIVDTEVKKSLHNLRKMAGWAMWWSSVQCALRVAFGLTIWLIWSLSVRPSGG